LGERLADQVVEQVEISVKYEGYVNRQNAALARASTDESALIPEGFDYAVIGALSWEARQVLAGQRPATLAQAGRLPGITPAALAVLRVHLKRMRKADSTSVELSSAA